MSQDVPVVFVGWAGMCSVKCIALGSERRVDEAM